MQRRNTYQRTVIYEILRGTDSHPTADWIYEKVKQVIPNISLGTVYRNLRVLKEEGLIIELNDGKQSRFDARTDNHYHFKCTNCERIYDIDKENVVDVDVSVLHKSGFSVEKIDITFSGICNICNVGEN